MNNIMTNDDTDLYESSSHEEEAYATSTAIVGECVIDSPYPTENTGSERNFSCRSRRTQRCKDESIPASSVLSTATSETVSSNGIVAQGLAWARKQRERRQRMQLQTQAEIQIRKIQLAQEQEQKDADERRNGISLSDNPTFQSFMRMSAFRYNGDVTIRAAASSSTSSSNGPLSSGIDYIDRSDDTRNHSSTLGILREYFLGTNTVNSSALKQPSLNQRSSSNTNSNSQLEIENNKQLLAEGGTATTKIIRSECGGYSVEIPIAADKIEDDQSWIPPIRVKKNERDFKSSTLVPYILTSYEMHQIASTVLPPGIVYCPWSRLYSLARDGDSFDACLRYIGSEKQTLLIVRTSQNEVFGGYADTPWNYGCNQNGPHYFGGPSSCLFRIAKVPQLNVQKRPTLINENTTTNTTATVSPTKPDHDNTNSKVICYKWTGINRYVLLCDASQKMLAFGGGGTEGAFGLCLENNFQFGSTGSCDTFANEPLTATSSSSSQSSFFDIIDMEVYGFLIGQF
jgi:TLD